MEEFIAKLFISIFSGFIELLETKLAGKRMVKNIYAKKSSYVCKTIKNGANVNYPDKKGHTPLMAAILCDESEIIMALLERTDVDINLRDYEGKTALIHAILMDRPVLAKHLVQMQDISLNVRDYATNTALVYAAIAGEIELMEMIKAKGGTP